MADANSLPWYREPWPWIVMSGPAIVVVAGIATAIIAVRTNDGLVADDYYRQGLDINRVLEREERARALDVSAAVQFREDREHVRVILRSRADPPRALRLTLVHPTRAGDDQVIVLTQSSPGVYDGAMGVPRAARHGLRLEDDAGAWRIVGDWPRGESSVSLGANR